MSGDKPSILAAITAKKEISFGWLLGAVVQGLASFSILVWTAATLVGDVSGLKVFEAEAKSQFAQWGAVTSAQAVELRRQAEVDAGFGVRLDGHDRRLERIEQRGR
jgi:hypothetical protein